MRKTINRFCKTLVLVFIASFALCFGCGDGANERSQKEAEYRRAQEEMADAMERFSKGEVTASYAMDKVAKAKAAGDNLYKDD